jgi:hypothetical protein
MTESKQSDSSTQHGNRGYHRYCRHACNVLGWLWRRRPDATQSLALSTWALAVVAFSALEDSRDALEQSQRAWIAPLGAAQLPEGSLKAGSAFRFEIQYANTGREPALAVNTLPGNAFHYPVPPRWKSGEWGDFVTGPNDSCSGSPPIKNGPVIYPINLFTTYNISQTIDDLSVVSLLTRAEFVLVYKGCITYETARRARESAYCFYLQPVDGTPAERWSFRTCDDGNHAN